jgi:hypothetical protein
MQELNYKLSLLKIVDDLSEISKTRDGNCPIKFVKDLEGIHVRSVNEFKTIMFTVDAPSENLNFEDDVLAFYDYSEFYKYLYTISDPKLSLGIVNKGTDREVLAITISKNKTKLVYPVSDPEVITGSRKGFNSKNTDALFKFNPENLIQIKKILGLIQGKRTLIKFVFSGKIVKVNIYSEDSNNTYENELELEEEVAEEFTLVISKEVFKHLITTNYLVEASSEGGYLRFNFDVDDNKCSVIVTSEDEE